MLVTDDGYFIKKLRKSLIYMDFLCVTNNRNILRFLQKNHSIFD